MVLYWIWLSEIKGIGPIIQKRLLEYFGPPEAIYHAIEKELIKVPGIGYHLIKEIKETPLTKALQILERCQQLNIKLLTFDDHCYPPKAKEYPLSPIILYYRGNLVENSIGVGIVGARRCSAYGKEVTKEVGAYLAKNKIPVISGMAKGIDGYAHISCLKNGGYTLAFLGCGVDICYPKEHNDLMEEVIENGAVLSQYPPGTKPKPEYFPKRNGLISAWSEKLLVVEAGRNSGALITAQYSKDLNREVLSVPNQIYSSTGKGTNQLIEAGAKIYLRPEQLLSNVEKVKIVNYEPNSIERNSESKVIKPENDKINTAIEQQVIDVLVDTPKTMDEIVEETKIKQLTLLEVITILELEGKINPLPGGRWIRRNRSI